MDLSEYVGRTFEPGTYTVEPWVAHLWTDATRSDEKTSGYTSGDERQSAPPVLGQLIAREAASTATLETELRDDFSRSDVFLGGHRFTFEEPIRVGVTYRARAEVTEVSNPTGESGGPAVLTVTYDVVRSDGTPAYEMETDLVIQEGEA